MDEEKSPQTRMIKNIIFNQGIGITEKAKKRKGIAGGGSVNYKSKF